MATNSSVLHDFVNELNSLGIELDARRRFCEEVTAFLRERNLVEDFNKYRARHKPAKTPPDASFIEDHDGEG